jgi:NhaP-type Na+/H+ or K+/H+ antiporter
MSLLVSLIYNRWASITTFSTGLKAGFVIGLLYTLSMNFFMYSSKEIDTKFIILLAIESIILAIVGGVVGYMCGIFNKNS